MPLDNKVANGVKDTELTLGYIWGTWEMERYQKFDKERLQHCYVPDIWENQTPKYRCTTGLLSRSQLK